MEEQTVVERVISFLMQHDSRFQLFVTTSNGSVLPNDSEKIIYNLLGFKMRNNDEITYYVDPKAFRDEICKNMHPRTVREILIKKNIIETEPNGRDKRCSFITPRRGMTTITIKNNYEDDI
jgi:hypothetical protein